MALGLHRFRVLYRRSQRAVPAAAAAAAASRTSHPLRTSHPPRTRGLSSTHGIFGTLVISGACSSSGSMRGWAARATSEERVAATAVASSAAMAPPAPGSLQRARQGSHIPTRQRRQWQSQQLLGMFGGFGRQAAFAARQ
eukprot:gene12071-biopygen12418